MVIAPYWSYWGKAKSDNDAELNYHLFPYHCLDVAAVAAVWWDKSHVIQRSFLQSSGLSAEQTRAWLLFFVALHDIGKLDVRFQLKAEKAWQALNPGYRPSDTHLMFDKCRSYYHGPAGLYWLGSELEEILTDKKAIEAGDDFDPFGMPESSSDSFSARQAWLPWLEAVTGHHGHIVKSELNDETSLPGFCAPHFKECDREARRAWVEQCADLFLAPAGLSLADEPPQPSSLLAGFCSITDWLGSASSEQHFRYQSQAADCRTYFQARCEQDAPRVLASTGLIGQSKTYGGVRALLKKGFEPRQLQTLVDRLPQHAGLTLIEAPTGSGKTETAVAQAWRLLDAGLAESIVFALPTQATANAMLKRLERLSTLLFGTPEVVLAHGNARFNRDFAELRSRALTAQGQDEAWAECSAWLAQSRKRAFLGQVGVCTIDQVLTSVLPIKHRFIRGFGLGRSVLIVDEVHAYDTYMYGLLKHVLKAQKAAGGSALLLSATLPGRQRRELLASWAEHENTGNPPLGKTAQQGSISPESLPYPLVTCCDQRIQFFDLNDQPDQLPKPRDVAIETYVSKAMQADEALLLRICEAAGRGANVVLVLNLVADAQKITRRLREMTECPVHLFHARYTFQHRQTIEQSVLELFGDEAISRGQILVATQVVEQSLDVDFDWMITQLCPVDLLFQRLGRLHRHAHKNGMRPSDFSQPLCTVLLPDDGDYGVHGKIYANMRVLWRTEQKLSALLEAPLCFPEAYRGWVESVYAESPWGNEPEYVEAAYKTFCDEVETIKRISAEMMVRSAMNPLPDDDDHVRAVTRDGEMSLSLVPCMETPEGRRLLDGKVWGRLNDDARPEALAMNSVGVPASWWNKWLKQYLPDNNEGPLWLQMIPTEDGWEAEFGRWKLRYTKELGMERIDGSVNG